MTHLPLLSAYTSSYCTISTLHIFCTISERKTSLTEISRRTMIHSHNRYAAQEKRIKMRHRG